jgi:hypothetical protein
VVEHELGHLGADVTPQPTREATHGPKTASLGPVATPERAGREGDTQPLPAPSSHPIAHLEVMKDLQARLDLGVRRYGQPLQPFNGRNALRDAYEEVLDLAVYLWTAIYEQEHARAHD